MASEVLDIPTACSRRGNVSTVGVVVDVLPPYQTKGTSACVTFTLKDSCFDLAPWQGGLKVKYFNDRIETLPNVKVNDVVLLRGIRINMFNDRATGVASQQDTVPFAIFRSESGPSSIPYIATGPIPFSLQPAEERAALNLLHGIATTTAQVDTPRSMQRKTVPEDYSPIVKASMMRSPVKSTLPFQLIQDVKPGPFVQILGQVVRMKTSDSEKCIMHLTDYTSNESLVDIKKDDEDEIGTEGDPLGYLPRKMRNWPGPWGKMTLQVVLWEPHATFARVHVKEGQLVLLTYTRIKPGNYSGLEAVVHEDKRFPNKIHVKVISSDNEMAQSLMERRKAYWQIHGKPAANPQTSPKKAKNSQKKKAGKVEDGQKELSLPAAQQTSTHNKPAARKTNAHIKTRSYEVPARSIEYIMSGETHINNIPDGIAYQLPFQNVCYRPEVRVVDFFPPKLEDFAVQVPMESIIADDDCDVRDHTQRMEWEWRFCLLVEGAEPAMSKNEARAQMKLFVTGAEAVHLLSLDPTDLRLNRTRLNELREKLFILWGDLEELKQSHATTTGSNEYWVPTKVSSVPFQCCIKEYGVRCSHSPDPDAMELDGLGRPSCSDPDCFGWERRFAMFGTTIHT